MKINKSNIGGRIAIPQAKNKAVSKPGLASMTVPEGVDYDAMDGMPSDVFFMTAAPSEGSNLYLEALARRSTILMDPEFKTNLLNAKTEDYQILAVTAFQQEFLILLWLRKL